MIYKDILFIHIKMHILVSVSPSALVSPTEMASLYDRGFQNPNLPIHLVDPRGPLQPIVQYEE